MADQMTIETPVRFPAGRIELAGTVSIPADPAPATRWPGVLLLASFLPRDRDGSFDRQAHPAWFADGDDEHRLLARLAAALARVGVASLRYDKRGCGQSEGEWETADLFALVDDARDAVTHLRQQPAVDPTRIGLVGHGDGGLIAMSVAPADPSIGPLTLIGVPARGVRDVLRWGASHRRGRGPAGVRALDRAAEELIERVDRREPGMDLVIGPERVHLGLRGWHQLFGTPGRALASLQDRSVTVVHGSADEWVNPAEASLLTAALPQPAGPARLLLGADHDLDQARDADLDEIAADLASRLERRALPTHLLEIDSAPPSR
jgi:alpha-beta hydrolase superfamily lysophospholipase